jgi:hypothetical protein
MKTTLCSAVTTLCVTGILTLAATSASAQSAEVKEKPPMYTYVSSWSFPRAKWGEVDKGNAGGDKMLASDLASGNIVGYGDDETIVHSADGYTHDNWWSGMSMAAVLNVLDEFYKAPGGVTSTLLVSATKHSDSIFVSRFYNWKSGAAKGAYTHAAAYKLKPDAPNDAVKILSQSLIVPLLEKLLVQGDLIEYEVDQEAIHTQSPDMFFVVFIAPNATGLDKVNAALAEALKSNALVGPGLRSMEDSSVHRDELLRTSVSYK